MRKSVLLPLSVALVALSFMSLLAPAQAAVYSDYARQDDYYFWFIHNYWELWLIVDTSADTLYFKWNAEDFRRVPFQWLQGCGRLLGVFA